MAPLARCREAPPTLQTADEETTRTVWCVHLLSVCGVSERRRVSVTWVRRCALCVLLLPSCLVLRFVSFLCIAVVLCCFVSPWRSCLCGRWRRRRCPTLRRRVRVRPVGRSSRRVVCVSPSVVCRLGSHRPAPTASLTGARMVGRGSCRCRWRPASACPAACGLCLRSCASVLCLFVCLFRFALCVITHNHFVSQQRASYRVWRQRLGMSLRNNRC